MDRSEFWLNGSRPIGVSDEKKVSKIAIDERILEVNSGDSIAIPIRFKNVIGAMTAKKSTKKVLHVQHF